MQNHNTLIEVLQRLIRSLDQVNSPYILDASFQVSTQEILVRNQEELQKEIKFYNATLKQQIETKVLENMETSIICL